MAGSMAQPPCFPNSLLGRTVTRINRILYEYRGEVRSDDGALEFEFSGGGVVRLDGAADGEQLCAVDARWEDPFREPLSAENARYVEEHGRWRRVDCSGLVGYADFIGQPVTAVRILRNRWGRVGGIRISSPNRTLWFAVDSDECRAYWAQPIGFSEEPVEQPR